MNTDGGYTLDGVYCFEIFLEFYQSPAYHFRSWRHAEHFKIDYHNDLDQNEQLIFFFIYYNTQSC